eukprot:g6554.t1
MDSTYSCKDGARWLLCTVWGTLLGFKDAYEVIVSNGPYPLLPPKREFIMEPIQEPLDQPQEDVMENNATELHTMSQPLPVDDIQDSEDDDDDNYEL